MDMFIDEEGYYVYTCKDNRLRCYDPKTKKTTSYPRVLMERNSVKLNRDDVVHHRDNNPLNNELDNLEIINEAEHARRHQTKYHDKIMECPWCGCLFLWTAHQQQQFYSNISRKIPKNNTTIGIPFCSKHCTGSYVRNEQLKGNL